MDTPFGNFRVEKLKEKLEESNPHHQEPLSHYEGKVGFSLDSVH